MATHGWHMPANEYQADNDIDHMVPMGLAKVSSKGVPAM